MFSASTRGLKRKTRLSPRAALRLLAVLSAALLFTGTGLTPVSAEESNVVDTRLEQQRRLYVEVRDSLARGSTRLYQRHRDTLVDYPLFPYLEYAALTHRLTLDKRDAVADFLERNEASWLGHRLRTQWLELLYRKREWRQYVDYYRPRLNSVELACHFHFAQYQTGEKQPALEGGLALWTVGKSQPKACDPLFHLLISEQQISNEIAWQRYTLAVQNHKFSLARYIEKFFTNEHYQREARHYAEVDRNPERVGEYDLLDPALPQTALIIGHGIRHLARSDATQALKHWGRYLQSHQIGDATKREVLTALVKGLNRQGYDAVAFAYLRDNYAFADIQLLEWQLRFFISQRDWQAIASWYPTLAENVQQQAKWRYWYARALLLHSGTLQDIERAKTLLLELSQLRNYYGFLAADSLGKAYAMQRHTGDISDAEISALAQQPAMQRVRELLYHQKTYQARREWYHTGRDFYARQWQIAAHLAAQWQWHQQAILSMIRADTWDNIDIRFPLAFREEFAPIAEKRQLPLPLVLAIARQESAFAADARSHAGARGLMQLMPATAKSVADKHKVTLNGVEELYQPQTNINLGTLYYRDLLDQYEGNRFLASAAYNAGPHRVKRWRKQSDSTLTFDAWIEVIPFNETRQYVQNVMAFAVIYGHHLELTQTLHTTNERSTLY